MSAAGRDPPHACESIEHDLEEFKHSSIQLRSLRWHLTGRRAIAIRTIAHHLCLQECTMNHTIHDIGVAKQIGAYSDAIETRANLRWLFTSGTPGLPVDGALPDDIAGQAELASAHVLRML